MPSGMSSQLTTTATPSQSPATYPTEHPIGAYVLLGPLTSTQTLFGTTSSPTSKPSNSIYIEQTTLSPSQQTPPSLPPSPAPTLQPINPGTPSPTWHHNSNPSNPRPTQPASSSPHINPVPSLSPDTKSPSKNLPISENVQNDTAETEYCPAGFTGVLPWNNCSAYYYCFNSVPHLPTILCSAGKQFDVHSNRCREASEVHCSSSTSTGSEPSHQPLPPTKSPLVQSSDSTQPISSPPSIEENDNPTLLILFDESSSAVDNASSDSDQNLQNTLYSWSSTTSYGSSTVNANTNSSLLPQDYHLGGTFITIEISFGGGSPGDIGWQLLSLDGSVSVSQPTGAYKNMTKNAVIYEGISLQRGSMTRSATIMQEFSWTILSVKGKGLGGGHWKLYNGSPIDENLLAVGDDFSYMDTVGIAVNGEGIVSLGDKQEQLVASVNTEKEEDDKSMAEIFAQTRDSLDSDESDHIVQSEDDDSSRNLKVILMSVILAAVLASVLLFALACRKKTVFDDDLTEDFDEWNVEAGTPPAEKGYYEDYYSTDDKQHVRDDMQDSSVSIDPPGSSFNGYEEKPPISNHTQQQLGTVGNNTIANKGTDVSEITAPSVFVEQENQNSNTAIDIENLVESTRANLEHTFDTCIYTILEKLESEIS